MSSWTTAFDLLKGHECKGCVKCKGKQSGKEYRHGEKHDDDNAYMMKQNLSNIAENATELHNTLDDEHDVPKWADMKAAVAADKLNTLNRYLSYKAKRGHMDKGMTSWFETPDPIYKSSWDNAFDLLKAEGDPPATPHPSSEVPSVARSSPAVSPAPASTPTVSVKGPGGGIGHADTLAAPSVGEAHTLDAPPGGKGERSPLYSTGSRELFKPASSPQAAQEKKGPVENVPVPRAIWKTHLENIKAGKMGDMRHAGIGAAMLEEAKIIPATHVKTLKENATQFAANHPESNSKNIPEWVRNNNYGRHWNNHLHAGLTEHLKKVLQTSPKQHADLLDMLSGFGKSWQEALDILKSIYGDIDVIKSSWDDAFDLLKGFEPPLAQIKPKVTSISPRRSPEGSVGVSRRNPVRVKKESFGPFGHVPPTTTNPYGVKGGWIENYFKYVNLGEKAKKGTLDPALSKLPYGKKLLRYFSSKFNPKYEGFKPGVARKSLFSSWDNAFDLLKGETSPPKVTGRKAPAVVKRASVPTAISESALEKVSKLPPNITTWSASKPTPGSYIKGTKKPVDPDDPRKGWTSRSLLKEPKPKTPPVVTKEPKVPGDIWPTEEQWKRIAKKVKPKRRRRRRRITLPPPLRVRDIKIEPTGRGGGREGTPTGPTKLMPVSKPTPRTLPPEYHKRYKKRKRKQKEQDVEDIKRAKKGREKKREEAARKRRQEKEDKTPKPHVIRHYMPRHGTVQGFD